jgi:hypothetical protein
MTDVPQIMNGYQLTYLLASVATVTILPQVAAWWSNLRQNAAIKADVKTVGVAVNGRTVEMCRVARELGYLEGLAAATKTERVVAVDLVHRREDAAVTALAVTVAAKNEAGAAP